MSFWKILSPVGAALALGMAALTGAHAQDYPTRAVTIIVPYAAGGSTDLVTRLIASKLEQKLGQAVVVENRPGGAGTIGVMAVKAADADGYTLLATNMPAVSEVFVQAPEHDPERDFVPVAGLYQTIYALAVNTTVPATTLGELVDHAKSGGQSLNYAAGFVTAQLPMVMLMKEAGFDMEAIPYRGSAPSIQALLANEVQALFDVAGTVAPLEKEGTARVLAVSSAERLPLMPDVPTTAELGFPAVVAGGTVGIWAPAGTPPAIVAKLNEAVGSALAEADVRERIAADGSLEVFAAPEDLLERYHAEKANWAELAEVAGYTPG